jgi:hypothetical protein
MPSNLLVLTADELEGVGSWIDAGGSPTDVVPGTANLLGVCIG